MTTDNGMHVLGIDTVTTSGGVALLVRGRPIARELGEPGRHAETLASSVETVLAEGNVDWNDLDLIGVNVGPGSFTGIRIGIAFALGLSRARQVPVAGVGCLDIHARACYDATSPKIGSYIISVSNVRRGEVVLARFRVGDGGPELQGQESLVPVVDPGSVPEAGSTVSGDGAFLVWPDHEVIRWEAQGTERAVATAKLAETAWSQGAPGDPTPRYARPADARPRRA